MATFGMKKRMGIKNHNPRKGTETIYKFIIQHLYYPLLLRITIPVRGRKQLHPSKDVLIPLPWRLRITIPVRGRKLCNFTHVIHLANSFKIKNHNPRKGTETIFEISLRKYWIRD